MLNKVRRSKCKAVRPGERVTHHKVARPLPYIKAKAPCPMFKMAEIEAWLEGGHVDAK